MLDQGNYFRLIILSLLLTCMQENVWIWWGEITCLSLLGVKGFKFILSKVSLLMKKAIIVCFRCGYIIAVGILFKLKNKPFYSRVLSR